MQKFTVIYWEDDGWLVGQLREIPGVFSQGKDLGELEKNIKEAYSLVIKDSIESMPVRDYRTVEVTFAA